MKKKIPKHLVVGNRFKKEFKKQVRSLILITLGFTIAFTWRQTFFDIIQSLVRWITGVEGKAISSILTSCVITFGCLGLILMSSYYFKEDRKVRY